MSVSDHVRHDHEGAARQGLPHEIGLGQRVHRIGAHDPDRFDPALVNGAEQIDRLQPRLCRQSGRVPEASDDVFMRWIADGHVGGELVGEPADLAPAHGVGLAGDGEGTAALAPDAARREMTVQDRVDLVRAAGRLVDALAIDGDGALGLCEEREEAPESRLIEPRLGGEAREIAIGQGGFERGLEPLRMRFDKGRSIRPVSLRWARRPRNKAVSPSERIGR